MEARLFRSVRGEVTALKFAIWGESQSSPRLVKLWFRRVAFKSTLAVCTCSKLDLLAKGSWYKMNRRSNQTCDSRPPLFLPSHMPLSKQKPACRLSAVFLLLHLSHARTKCLVHRPLKAFHLLAADRCGYKSLSGKLFVWETDQKWKYVPSL